MACKRGGLRQNAAGLTIMTNAFPHRYSVRPYRGKPVFMADSKAVGLPSYCSCGAAWREQWLAAHRNFARHDCMIFWLQPTGGYNGEWGTTPFWTGPGEIHCPPIKMPDDYFGVDEQARERAW